MNDRHWQTLFNLLTAAEVSAGLAEQTVSLQSHLNQRLVLHPVCKEL